MSDGGKRTGSPSCEKLLSAFVGHLADQLRGNGFQTRKADGRDTTNYVGRLDPEGRDFEPE